MESSAKDIRKKTSPMIGSLFGISLAVSPPIVVCPECPISSVKQAIKEAKSGAVITIRKGIYREGKILVDKSVVLRGEGDPVLDAEGKTEVLTIQADGVEVSDLVIANSGRSYIEELAGIKVQDSKNCVLQRNYLTNNTYGIYLAGVENCKIIGNYLKGAPGSETEAGNGIHIWSGKGFVIENNRVTGHRDGIYLEFASDSHIRNNSVEGNMRYGLHFMESHRNEFNNNRFVGNGAGVAVMYSKQVEMVGNDFADNNGPASYGLLLKEISASKIERNRFLRNTVGVFMEGTNRCQFSYNEFLSNGWAIRLTGSSENNTFKNNNVIGNTFDVATNTSRSNNTFTENYWSRYDGYDLNRDGIGDKLFRPVSLSSVIIERVDSSFVLLRSFFFSVLDEVERALPELIPQDLKDDRPLMTKVIGHDSGR